MAHCPIPTLSAAAAAAAAAAKCTRMFVTPPAAAAAATLLCIERPREYDVLCQGTLVNQGECCDVTWHQQQQHRCWRRECSIRMQRLCSDISCGSSQSHQHLWHVSSSSSMQQQHDGFRQQQQQQQVAMSAAFAVIFCMLHLSHLWAGVCV
jgi:hypothetical protein